MAETTLRAVIKQRGRDQRGLTLIMAETIHRAVVKRRGRDQQGLTLIMAETIRRAVIKRRGRNRRGLTSQNELASLPADQEFTPSLPGGENNSCICAKQSTDQRTRCDTERTGKKSNEKINKHKLILIAAADLHTTR